MEDLRRELCNKLHWEETYNKMVLKQGISKADKDLIWELKEIYKDDIIDEIMSGVYKWSIPRKVEIAKHENSKKRVVYIYDIKDRFILGVLYRAVSRYFREYVPDTCFSYKKGTSTSNAIEYINNSRENQNYLGVKVDIHSYFNSVSRERVTEIINELFSGGIKITIENLLLDDKVLWKGKIINEWKSLIPGCAFGSFLANWCLRECDIVFKNKIYARYSDDIVILDKTVDYLNNDLNILRAYLDKYGLTINKDKYTWFTENDSIQFLGLKLYNNGVIDISDHAKHKIKKQIHRWCRKGRMEVERDGTPYDVVLRKIIRQINNKNFKCYVKNESNFGWAIYAFSRITTIDSLKEIDIYTKDSLRVVKTGKHNKANAKKCTDDELKDLGWVSLVELYKLFKFDFDYYYEVIELL